MNADDVNPIPLLVATARLVAKPTAVAVARMYTRYTLTRWELGEQIDTATLVVSELVTNAVLATEARPQPRNAVTKTTGVVGVQLRAIEASLFIEIFDATDESPVRRSPAPEAEGGRGLLLVDVLAKRWDIHRSRVGGKIVWAELPLGLPLMPSPFDTMPVPLQLPAGSRAERGSEDEQARMALFDRLLDTTASVMCARVNDGT
ncbi:hypothetical protein SZN_16415 [Streptomyces zinciresistens K42]|uniref:Histidine kinase/HSP90-like ATPase domain-containing protein n=1 Tax=Streptomyces zinciresistens K42 TaxID=700597 RepID=G2GCQ8_9ACTN|nr:ATP-binding protein [Streptomyces zinciresistens]EGX58719.1 hypothetical protein SZN_16415 [Streptomyces zinciresistens K42]